MKNLLDKTMVYVEARNSNASSIDNPMRGTDFIGTFTSDIDQFLVSNSKDIYDWTPSPDDYIDDSTERANFVYYIKWND